jgi:hypothetical protein
MNPAVSQIRRILGPMRAAVPAWLTRPGSAPGHRAFANGMGTSHSQPQGSRAGYPSVGCVARRHLRRTA